MSDDQFYSFVISTLRLFLGFCHVLDLILHPALFVILSNTRSVPDLRELPAREAEREPHLTVSGQRHVPASLASRRRLVCR